MIYLDNAATTFPKPDCVYTTVDYVQRNSAVNAGRGSYNIAAEALRTVDETRFLMAKFVNATSPDCVVFTPSATLAANEIILGLDWDEYKTVYISPFEHNAIARPIEVIKKRYGISVIQLPFSMETHELDMEKMERMFSANPPDYIFINHISNVTGTISPIGTITNSAKSYDAIVVVDGSQSVGLVEIDLQKIAIDYLIFAGHKNLYSSWGIGGFINNSAFSLQPILAGGTGSDSLNLNMQTSTPLGFEMGSPNIIAISSLNSSLKWLFDIGIDAIAKKKKILMDRLILGLESTSAKLYLPGKDVKHTSVLSFNLPDYEPSEVGAILNQDYDIAVRTGYHCAPYIHEFLDTVHTHGTVRASLSLFNTEDDIDALIKAVSEI